MFPMRKYREFRHSGLDPESSPANYHACFAHRWILASAGMTFMLFVLFVLPINSPSGILGDHKFKRHRVFAGWFRCVYGLRRDPNFPNAMLSVPG